MRWRAVAIHTFGCGRLPRTTDVADRLARTGRRPMPTPRFLTLDDVAEVLNVSWSQAYALVRRKELIAIQIGGRGQGRVEGDELQALIPRKEAEGPAGGGARAGAVTDDDAAAPEDTAPNSGSRNRS